MADEYFSRAPTQAGTRAAPRGGGRYIAMGIVLAFILGAGAVAYLGWAGLLPFGSKAPDRLLIDGGTTTVSSPPSPAALPSAVPSAASAAAQIPAPQVPAAQAVEARMAALEQRIVQIDLRTAAVSGNSARAEGLLIAFAARRALDRGAPLGLLEDQLKLRFADAQPNAVATLITAGQKPVTLGDLLSRLDSLSPSLSAVPAAQIGTWQRMRHEFANLFVIRRESAPSPAPANRLDRARQALEAGRIDDAIAEVQRLPGAGDADGWIADARRYADTRAALDLIETTTLLDTRSMKDSAGNKVEQVSPVSAPTVAPPAN